VRRVWPPFALLAAAVGLWELIVRAARVPDYLFPTPSAVASSFGNDAGLLGNATLVTLREIVLGYLLAVAVALAIAVALHFSAALRRALLPILVLSQTVPTVLLAPILAILLGYGIEPKLVVVTVVCFFPIVVNTVDGLRAADPELLRMMRTLHGAGSRSSAASSCRARCRRSSPARAWRPPTRRSAPSSASGPAPRPGSAS
jgi:putative hydroxymethylpyrimidine transport system permease protein